MQQRPVHATRRIDDLDRITRPRPQDDEQLASLIRSQIDRVADREYPGNEEARGAHLGGPTRFACGGVELRRSGTLFNEGAPWRCRASSWDECVFYAIEETAIVDPVAAGLRELFQQLAFLA